MTRRIGAVARACTAAALALALSAPARAATTINVEVDWMVDTDHSHEPSQAELDAIVAMFACKGITLNVVKSDAIPHLDVITDGAAANDFFTATGPGTFSNLKATYRDNTGAGWRYCIFGHDYQEDGVGIGSSGLGETPGDDFVVTLGSFSGQTGTAFDRAATFAHELGHTLGLRHAGSMDQAVVGNGVAIYPSIMSYAFQLRGIRTHMQCMGLTHAWSLFKDIDYSSGRMPNVNESSLNEAQGMGMNPVDWDCGGTISGTVAQDLDTSAGSWCASAGGLQQLSDFNDWATVLAASEPNAPADAVGPPDEHEPCISHEENLRVSAASDCSVVQPTLVTEACPAGQMVFVDPAYGGAQFGTGTQPYANFVNAFVFSLSGSVVHFKPGTYFTGTGVLNKPLVIAAPAGATLVP